MLAAMIARRSVLWLCVSISVAACGDSDECADGLGLDGICVDSVVASRRAAGAWDDSATLTTAPIAGGVVATIEADGDAEALAVTLASLDVDAMFQQGYQSWGFAGTVVIPRAVAADADGFPLMEAARTGDPVHEERGVSYHAALFRRGDEGPVLVVGAASARRAVTGIAAVRDDDDRVTITIVYGPARDRIAADDDGTARSEGIVIATADHPAAAFDLLSAQLVEAHPEAAAKRPPGGWFSWNEHYADIDASLIEAHVDAVAGELAPLGMPLVEIDDGWERHWGDWRANDRFPDGMEAVAGTITDAGLVAGIWLAPFLVDVESETAAGDPSLFVQTADGEPLVHQISGNPRSFYVLDGTNPASMAIATAHLERFAAAGYSFFKLDFLYAGALPGVRSADVTGTEALRQGMARIREAVGDDAVINACGSPTLPVLGIADSLRIGPDTAFEGFDLSWALVASAARNLAARRYLFPVIWPDADQVQVRAPYTLEEARAGVFVAALAGPAFSVGDDLVALPEDRLALTVDGAILDLAGAAEPARVDGIMTQPTDEIPASPVFETFRFPNGIATEPPPSYRMVGASGDVYTIDIDWAEHTVSFANAQP